MMTSDTTEDKTVPAMAWDARRVWLASFLAFAPGIAFGLTGVGLESDASAGLRFVYAVLVIWLFFGLTYLILTVRFFSRATGDMLAHWLRESTPRTRASRFWLWVSGGSGISWASQGAVIAVVIVLSLSFSPESRSSPAIMISGIGAVVGSWLLIVASFAVQYARTNVNVVGLELPRDKSPVFGDYLYIAIQVSTSYSSGDAVTVTSSMRRLIALHSIIAFGFNTVIIAILVSALISVAP